MKLDPKNTEASTQKLKLLENQVGLTTQKLALLKQKQIEANQLFAKGEISAKEYSKIQVAVMKTENEVAKLNQEIKKMQKDIIKLMVIQLNMNLKKKN